VLSDHERDALREVECQFQADAPRFARSFGARQARLERRPRKLGARLAVVAAALLAAFLLLAGSLAGALAVAFTAGMIWVAWRHSAGTGRSAS
jgi:hypothetical protein